MSYMTAGKLQAFEALMTEKPGFEHYDSGCDGICPECRQTGNTSPVFSRNARTTLTLFQPESCGSSVAPRIPSPRTKGAILWRSTV